MRQFLHQLGWTNYLAICLVWLLAYFLPIILIENTSWYGQNFHIAQSLVPLFLIFAVYRLTQARWREELGFILILQILHNLADVVWEDSWQAYDLRQTVLNGMELAILLGWGLPELIYKTLKAHRMRRDSRLHVDNSDSRRGLAEDRKGLHGNVG